VSSTNSTQVRMIERLLAESRGIEAERDFAKAAAAARSMAPTKVFLGSRLPDTLSSIKPSEQSLRDGTWGLWSSARSHPVLTRQGEINVWFAVALTASVTIAVIAALVMVLV
jgi:hypothetical protein